MFTLGNKEAIVNLASQAVYTPAAATPAAMLNIQGLGTFDPTTVTDAKGRRYSAAQLEKLQFTCPTSAELGIATTAVNVPVSVKFKVYNLRNASELAIDFVKQGRTFAIEILVQGNTNAAAVAVVVDAAITAYKAKFNNSDFPFTHAVSTDYITLTGTEGFYSFGEEVVFKVNRNLTPYVAVTTRYFDIGYNVNDGSISNGDTTLILGAGAVGVLMVGDTIHFSGTAAVAAVEYKITEIVTSSNTITFTPALATATLPTTGCDIFKRVVAVEAVGDGKALEESVRMSTYWTADTYAINPGKVPIIGASYTMIQFTCSIPTAAGGWEAHAVPGIDGAAVNQQVVTIYFNEATCIAGGGPVALLIAWLDAALVANGTGTTFVWLKKANGASSVSLANFIA